MQTEKQHTILNSGCEWKKEISSAYRFINMTWKWISANKGCVYLVWLPSRTFCISARSHVTSCINTTTAGELPCMNGSSQCERWTIENRQKFISCKSNLTKHLRQHGINVMCTVFDVLRSPSPSVTVTLALKGKTTKDKTEECRRAVMAFVVKGLHPFSVVETPSFR